MRIWVAVVLAGLAGSAWGQEDKPMQPAAEQPAKPAEKPADKPSSEPETKQTENLPAAADLFEKHIAAIGGIEGLKAEKNRLVRGKYVTGRGDQGTLRIMRVAPNKMNQYLEIPGVSTYEIWCDGESAWVRDSNRGTRRLQGADLADQCRQSDILGECNYKAHYKEIKTVAREKFGEADAYVVRAVQNQGKDRTLYFDAKSGLLIGVRLPGEYGPESDFVTTLSDYKKFGDTLHPTKSVTKSGSTELATVTFTQIESNLTSLPSVAPPDEVREVK